MSSPQICRSGKSKNRRYELRPHITWQPSSSSGETYTQNNPPVNQEIVNPIEVRNLSAWGQLGRSGEVLHIEDLPNASNAQNVLTLIPNQSLSTLTELVALTRQWQLMINMHHRTTNDGLRTRHRASTTSGENYTFGKPRSKRKLSSFKLSCGQSAE